MPDNLVECANCGWVITRDRLEKDARGKPRCPRCGKKFAAPADNKKEKEIVCSVCGRSDMQQRWVHEGKVYCETCHKNINAPRTEKKADPGKAVTGVSSRPGVTTVEDPEKLITCPSCDIVLTRDRLAGKQARETLLPEMRPRSRIPDPRAGRSPGPKITMSPRSCSSASVTPAGSRSSSRSAKKSCACSSSWRSPGTRTPPYPTT